MEDMKKMNIKMRRNPKSKRGKSSNNHFFFKKKTFVFSFSSNFSFRCPKKKPLHITKKFFVSEKIFGVPKAPPPRNVASQKKASCTPQKVAPDFRP